MDYNNLVRQDGQKARVPCHTYAFIEGKWEVVEGAVWSKAKGMYWVTRWGANRCWVDFPHVVFQLDLFQDADLGSPES